MNKILEIEQDYVNDKIKKLEFEEEINLDKYEELLKMRKTPMNIIFVGHVDCGKSTICGQILYLLGVVSDEEI